MRIVSVKCAKKLSILILQKLTQRSARVSMEFHYHDWSRSWQKISMSWWALVSISKIFLSLNESRSWYPRNFPVSMSLGLNIQEISQSRWVSVSKSKKSLVVYESRSQHPTCFPVSTSTKYEILLESLRKKKLYDFNQNLFIY